MTRIDAHHHFWDLSARPQRWLTGPGLRPIHRDFGPADLAPELAAAGIDRTVLVQVLPSTEETREFLELAASGAFGVTGRSGASGAPVAGVPGVPGAPDVVNAPGASGGSGAADVPGASGVADAPGASGMTDLSDVTDVTDVTGPSVAGVVGWVDLTGPSVGDQLTALRAGPGGERLVGVRHLVQDEPDPGWLTRADVIAGLRAVHLAGLTYDLLVRPPQLPAAIAAVRAVPELRFVLDHLAKPPIASGQLAGWAGPLRELAAEPNVVAKLSGLVTEAEPGRWTIGDLRPYVDVALAAFGPARLAFGSDWPVCRLAADYPTVVAVLERLLAELTPAERAEIFAGTATRAYRLAP